MAIQVTINDASITQEGLALAITTQNSAHPGEEYRFRKAYDTALSAQEIKAQIDADITLLWQAMGSSSWTI